MKEYASVLSANTCHSMIELWDFPFCHLQSFVCQFMIAHMRSVGRLAILISPRSLLNNSETISPQRKCRGKLLFIRRRLIFDICTSVVLVCVCILWAIFTHMTRNRWRIPKLDRAPHGRLAHRISSTRTLSSLARTRAKTKQLFLFFPGQLIATRTRVVASNGLRRPEIARVRSNGIADLRRGHAPFVESRRRVPRNRLTS